jgi:hypothetical protein
VHYLSLFFFKNYLFIYLFLLWKRKCHHCFLFFGVKRITMAHSVIIILFLCGLVGAWGETMSTVLCTLHTLFIIIFFLLRIIVVLSFFFATKRTTTTLCAIIVLFKCDPCRSVGKDDKHECCLLPFFFCCKKNNDNIVIIVFFFLLRRGRQRHCVLLLSFSGVVLQDRGER